MPGEFVYVKAWKVSSRETMIAVCDCNVIGKKVCEGKLVLDISKDFYQGERMTVEAAIDVLRTATVANFVGKDAVRCGIEAGLVHKDAVISIGGIPHAQFVQI
ncbi:MAG: DUF424 family protein [Candidatus Verstraetearchaeota archaeon]|nr:DUF424 family protein [Candidatus Verstraetearchaeota archaeon]